MQLCLNSKVRDLYSHPLGRDIVDKLLLQLGRPEWSLDKVSGLRLKTLKRIAGRKVGPEFFNAVLDLLNSEPDIPSNEEAFPSPAWWKEAVFYQVYPRSFTYDGLKGIINKLDYLRELGINAVWLSPVYDSPNDDNGYDIRDYYSIMPEFGNMREMDALISGLHRRGMKLVMDLVINHTSDEHPWFQDALHNPNSPYRDFYFFRKGRGNQPPNNWTSFFGGSAWNYYPKQDIWALHLFSKKQMDLNWESPALRGEIHKIVRWWLAKGVDGFRLDVINYISKYDGLPDGDEFIGELMNYTGVERYFYGPKLHEYLRELRREAFMPYNAFAVGETPGIGPMAGRLLTDAYREELDMIFSFDHLEAPGKTRFDDYQYDLQHLKDFYVKQLNADGGHGWHTLFYNNHDNPRMLSKIDPTGEYAEPLAKLLAVLQFTLRGTPFIYQGDEIGARNEDFASIDEIADVESLGLYEDFLAEGQTQEEAFSRILAGTRDHARAMMKWEEVARQQDVNESVWRFYQKIIAWRKKMPACVYGELTFWDAEDARLFCYSRNHEDVNIFVEVNLSTEIAISTNPEGAMFVLGNYRNLVSDMQAYEARVYVY
ncbi:MAG: alpha-glucosidase [Defluviitaleaceae bacterium]|nr:alpha-glucosidase [Defluviitaleaceae bacterium]